MPIWAKYDGAMHNPYSPPKSDIVRKQPAKGVNRLYRIANWLYTLIMVFGFVALLTGRSIRLEWEHFVVLFLMFSPVLGYQLATTIKGQGYILWSVVHWSVVFILLIFSLYEMNKETTALGVGVFLLLVNLLSVISNRYYRNKSIEASQVDN